ncbi:MAG: tol-pal system protein YbgF [Gammaproteobacteria bacterium]|nr:tol-pal system protein YbgF [Gammaproteobacteria bacterium]
MTVLPIKPASFAGFLLLSNILNVAPIVAQDYVDVEAERRAAAAEPPLEETSPVTPATSYTGIQPYSGSTTMAQPPVENTTAPITGTDSGSLMLRVQQLEADVRRLNGLLEEATQALRLLEAQSLERYVDLDRRLASGAAEENDEVAGSTDVAPIPAPSDTPASGRAVDAQEGEEAAYRAAYELVREREFDDAVAAFTAFLADFPFGRYAPNAHYWLGELYLVLDPPDPELARQNFKLLLDQYPADPKVPDALYKLGRVQFIKGNRQRSKEYLDEVIREYPSHAAAQLARQFLLENF